MFSSDTRVGMGVLQGLAVGSDVAGYLSITFPTRCINYLADGFGVIFLFGTLVPHVDERQIFRLPFSGQG